MTVHNGMRQRVRQLSPESVSILHELDLGEHTLVLMSDGSIDLLVNDEQTPSLAQRGLRLDSTETYRLFISLHEQFQHKGSMLISKLDDTREEERT